MQPTVVADEVCDNTRLRSLERGGEARCCRKYGYVTTEKLSPDSHVAHVYFARIAHFYFAGWQSISAV